MDMCCSVMDKHEVIHETGSRQVFSSEEDRGTATVSFSMDMSFLGGRL